ncbi:MAG TPA: cupin domain-containing protein [Trebonia sp.]
MAHGQSFAASATAEQDRASRPASGRPASGRPASGAFGAGRPDGTTAPDHGADQRATCAVIRPTAVEEQGLTLSTGISQDTVGSKALCMRLMMLPPGTRGTPHAHKGHESAIWVAMGEAEVWHGPGLCGRTVVHAGDFLYIPPGIPHLPVNRSETKMMVAVMARTDPAERESVTLCDLPPHLAGLFAVPVATGV